MNKPSHEYLATGFAHVDERQSVLPFSNCLGLLDSLPYFQEYKRRSYELLELARGHDVLDVGCGLGDDVLRMSQLVAPKGRVVGVDASSTLLTEARTRMGKARNVTFVEANAKALPFSDGSFDRCRVDRTLQHVPGPDDAVRDMTRVLAGGGILLAYDNDWGTFSISSVDTVVTRLLQECWCDSFTNGWVGRYLAGYFRDAGLEDVRTLPSVSVTTDFELADRIYNLRETTRRAVERGAISQATGEAWISDLIARTDAGRFQCSLTAYTVIGRKTTNGLPNEPWHL